MPTKAAWDGRVRTACDNNARRSATAAARTVSKAKVAIETISNAGPTNRARTSEARREYLYVLRLRVKYPDYSLAQLADRAGMTKDAYWSQLRRALLHANKIRLNAGR